MCVCVRVCVCVCVCDGLGRGEERQRECFPSAFWLNVFFLLEAVMLGNMFVCEYGCFTIWTITYHRTHSLSLFTPHLCTNSFKT